MRILVIISFRFIGELFKLNMLSSHIMHSCVAKLLKSKTDEESLESFCKLISTVGSRLEAGNERAPEVSRKHFVEHKGINSIHLIFENIN